MASKISSWMWWQMRYTTTRCWHCTIFNKEAIWRALWTHGFRYAINRFISGTLGPRFCCHDFERHINSTSLLITKLIYKQNSVLWTHAFRYAIDSLYNRDFGIKILLPCLFQTSSKFDKLACYKTYFAKESVLWDPKTWCLYRGCAYIERAYKFSPL